jgi:hypothetical protein
MPTVLRERGFAVRIYLPPREHRPPQVHVVRGRGEVKIHLGTESTPPGVERVFQMRDADGVKAYRIVLQHHAQLLVKRRQYHGYVPGYGP